MEQIKIAIYSRKSKFVENSESTDNQINICKNYCKLNYTGDICFDIYEDEGFSGKNDKRPEYQRLLKNLNLKNIDVVICYKLDRISRNVSDFNNLIELLNKLNVDFISVNEKFDTSHAMGRAMMSITAVFAQLERETIGQRIKDNLSELSKSGRFINNKSPFGFSKITNYYTDKNEKQKKFNSIIINEEEVKIVKLAFEKYLEFESINKVTNYFLSLGIRTRNNNSFKNIGIKRLLTNYFYCTADKNIYNYLTSIGAKDLTNIDNWTGEFGVNIYRKTTKNNSSIIFNVGSHKPIIDSKTFINVQNIIKGRNNLSIRREKSTTLLTGLIKCKHCNSYLRPQAYQKNGNFYYVCELKEKSKKEKCTVNNIRGDIFEKEFLEQLIKNFNFKETIKINDFKYISTNKSLNLNNQINNLLLQLINLEDEITKKYIVDKINKLHKELETLEQLDLDDSYFKIDENELFYKNRALVRSLIKEILWNGEFFEVNFI